MSNKQPFQKFIQQKESGAKKKERIRQEKKKARQETKKYFEQKKLERRGQGTDYRAQETRHKGQDSRYKPQRSEVPMKAGEQGSRDKVQGTRFKPQRSEVPLKAGGQGSRDKVQETRFKSQDSRDKGQKAISKKPVTGKAPATGNMPPVTKHPGKQSPQQLMPLNKFIAHAGVCARRDAAALVKAGKVTVNGQQVTEPGYKVSGSEEVKVNGKKIAIRRNLVYILLNKPKDYITTTDDPQGRKTVLDIIKNATPERVYPIGRLDRNTTGVLLLTNDGELAQKLSHPSYEVKKIYEVKLDKPLVKKDFDALLKGITLEDGFIAPDVLAYSDTKDKSIIGIEIHSGRNRIVRRIFESLGYDVRNLDRVMYANLTKKNVERGKWRFLSEKEVRLLKYLNASYTRK